MQTLGARAIAGTWCMAGCLGHMYMAMGAVINYNIWLQLLLFFRDFTHSQSFFEERRPGQSVPSITVNHIASTDKEKADMLYTFFASCWNSSELPLSEEAYSNQSTFEDLEVIITPEYVLHLINGLDTTKANGPDVISAFMLKATANSIASSLAKLFTLSLSKGKFPTMLKKANIVPILKSSSISHPSDYRPVSLLYIVSKLLEKLVHSLVDGNTN